jgi:hypothetical protein
MSDTKTEGAGNKAAPSTISAQPVLVQPVSGSPFGEKLPPDILARAKAQLEAEGYFDEVKKSIGALGQTQVAAPVLDLDAVAAKVAESLKQQGWRPPKTEGEADEYRPPNPREMLAELHKQPKVLVNIPVPEYIASMPEFQQGKVVTRISPSINGCYFHIDKGKPTLVPRSIYEVLLANGAVPPMSEEDMRFAPQIGPKRTKYIGDNEELKRAQVVYGTYDANPPRPAAGIKEIADSEVLRKAGVDMEGPPGARRAPEARAA